MGLACSRRCSHRSPVAFLPHHGLLLVNTGDYLALRFRGVRRFVAELNRDSAVSERPPARGGVDSAASRTPAADIAARAQQRLVDVVARAGGSLGRANQILPAGLTSSATTSSASSATPRRSGCHAQFWLDRPPGRPRARARGQAIFDGTAAWSEFWMAR
jgi:hypothetical protein